MNSALQRTTGAPGRFVGFVRLRDVVSNSQIAKTLSMILFFRLFFCVSGMAQGTGSLVNFTHLEHLTEKIGFLGDSVAVVHTYSNYPDYQWDTTNGEGIACVDDAARAAVVYLRYYELTRNKGALEQAKLLLRFVMKMETEEGDFYNFIFKDHSINTAGRTSSKLFGWWAARGVWSMSLGYRLLRDRDREFAAELKTHIVRTFPHIDSLLLNFSRIQSIQGYRVPQWMLYESGADATSELLLGLIEYSDADRDSRVLDFIGRHAEGLMVMQDGDIRTFPFGLHRSWKTMWHMWGNGQTQALAAAGKLLKDGRMIRSAEREAEGFYSRLLIDGFMKEMDVVDSTGASRCEQIAYAVRPMAVGLIRLYESTGKIRYLKMAGLAASWFFGNNLLNQQMYDPANGRCFDGISDPKTVNKNSGAESTIEALYVFTELERYGPAKKYLQFKKVKQGAAPGYLYAVFENTAHQEITLEIDLKKSELALLEGGKSVAFRKRFINE
jgi:hypothetical protein